jgi:bifunctional DNA-binding transcriptional regulator/antitoxin component of YhaV-PrlF toxin-antitoxin module
MDVTTDPTDARERRATSRALLHYRYAAVMRSYLLHVQARGTIALPADLRRRLRLDTEDAQVRLLETDDGRIELVPVVAVPAEQAWFWSDRWQQMEREADADIAAGRSTVVDDADALMDEFAPDA